MAEIKQLKDPVSRRRFLAVGGSGTAVAAFLAACGDDSGTTTTTSTMGSGGGASETAEFGKGDIGILNYALTLEYLETAFYAEVVKSGLFKGADLETIRKFGAEEAEHVEALTAAVKQLGGKPAPEPKAEFPLKNAKSVLELAGTVENLGAAAYLGQAPNIQSPEVLASALAIHSVEGRHAAALNTLLGDVDHPGRRLRQAGRRADRPQVRRTVPGRLNPRDRRRRAMNKQQLQTPELAAVEVDVEGGDLSRSDVILKGALAAGAIYGSAMVSPFVRKALAMSESGDVGILNFALTLEYLESTFYEEAKSRAKASGRTEEPRQPDRRPTSSSTSKR